MNPFNERPMNLADTLMDWRAIYPAPYDKHTVDPYTRTRVILMNGTEFEANGFSHQFSRHATDNDLRRELALIRRSEQQQQKLLSALKPMDETLLEHTIGYEQLAVDLTAALALREPNGNVKAALDFALLEDFDHLYRYADLMELESGVLAEYLVGNYTEIMPGRPTISEHRCPFDSIRPYIDAKQDALETKLCVGIITAAEQQTMNYYMNVNGAYTSELGRRLYQEIGMIEEQHVTQYGSLMDPRQTWLESLLMHQYTECYLYWSCAQTEPDMRIRGIWQMLFEQEIAHLHKAAEMLERLEGKHFSQVVGSGEFPEPLLLCSQIDYVRGVLTSTVENTAVREGYANVGQLPPDSDFFEYQRRVNPSESIVPSHIVIERTIARDGRDYRFETAPHPIPELRGRQQDNTAVGRQPAYDYARV